MEERIIILGAAGRDFHNFNMLYRYDANVKVVAFTAAQIPFIDERRYPPVLAGPNYPEGILIFSEERLIEIIRRFKATKAVFSYSDVTFSHVMRLATLCNSNNASFELLAPDKTMLKSTKPVISVCAIRTGCGKSAISRYIAGIIKSKALMPIAIRHPMPYGDLAKQIIQRFSTSEDVSNANCTIEEMEEYEPLVEAGITVYAGVDYESILAKAQTEADVIVWDGGNNDLPFIKPDLEIVVTDALRPGDELGYYPGETNLRRAHVIVINKVNSANRDAIALIRKNINNANPEAMIIELASAVECTADIAGKRLLVIEDGPTLTHGNMPYGAGAYAARKSGAKLVDPRPYAVGSIKEAFTKYSHLDSILPAMGYSAEQIKELEATINSTPCDAVLIATPVDLTRLIRIEKPSIRVTYGVEEFEEPGLVNVINEFLEKLP